MWAIPHRSRRISTGRSSPGTVSLLGRPRAGVGQGQEQAAKEHVATQLKPISYVHVRLGCQGVVGSLLRSRRRQHLFVHRPRRRELRLDVLPAPGRDTVALPYRSGKPVDPGDEVRGVLPRVDRPARDLDVDRAGVTEDGGVRLIGVRWARGTERDPAAPLAGDKLLDFGREPVAGGLRLGDDFAVSDHFDAIEGILGRDPAPDAQAGAGPTRTVSPGAWPSALNSNIGPLVTNVRPAFRPSIQPS